MVCTRLVGSALHKIGQSQLFQNSFNWQINFFPNLFCDCTFLNHKVFGFDNQNKIHYPKNDNSSDIIAVSNLWTVKRDFQISKHHLISQRENLIMSYTIVWGKPTETRWTEPNTICTLPRREVSRNRDVGYLPICNSKMSELYCRTVTHCTCTCVDWTSLYLCADFSSWKSANHVWPCWNFGLVIKDITLINIVTWVYLIFWKYKCPSTLEINDFGFEIKWHKITRIWL